MGAQSDPASTVQGHVAGPAAGDGVTAYDVSGNQRVVLGKIASNPDDYGLKVVSSDGSTTIIDGTSDMFKITASGTFSVAVLASAATSGEVTLTGLGTVTVTPAILPMIALDDATNAALREVGISIGTNNNSYAVGYAYIVSSQVHVGMLVNNLGSGSPHTFYCRYYTLLEVGM